MLLNVFIYISISISSHLELSKECYTVNTLRYIMHSTTGRAEIKR